MAVRRRMTLEEILAHLDLCASTECSFCRDGCPSYRSYNLESRSPRGKNRIIGAHLREREPDVGSLSSVAFECTVCGRCGEVCISGGDTSAIIPGIRRLLADRGLAPGPIQRSAVDAVKKGTPYPSKDRTWADGLPERGKVGYFPGCNFMANEPDVPARTVEVLKGIGIEPVAVFDNCCGGPAFNAGLDDMFLENADRFLADLKEKGIRRLIVSCPGCLDILKNEFPRSGVEFVHIVEVLSGARDGSAKGMRVAYHDPCNLGRKSGVLDAPRVLLRAIGAEVLEFSDHGTEATCCGGGGGFATLHPERSLEPARRRVAEAVGMGADAIVTACRTCRDRLAEASEGRVPVHLVLDLVDGTVSGAPVLSGGCGGADVD